MNDAKIEKQRQAFELTKIVLEARIIEGGETQMVLVNTINAPTQTLVFPTNTQSPPTEIPPSATSTPDTRLFWDDFNNGLRPEWNLVTGQCSMSNGLLICADKGGRIEVGDFNWTNYQVSFDTAGYWTPGWAFLLIRLNESGGYFKFNMNVCRNATWSYHNPDGSEQEVSQVNGSVCENGVAHIKIQVKNDLIYTSINGNSVGVFQDGRSLEGKIGFYLNGPWIDNVEVIQLAP